MKNRRKGLLWGGLITGIIGLGWLILFVQGVAFDVAIKLPGPIAWFDIVASTLAILGSMYIACKRGGISVVILIAGTILVSTANSIIIIGTEFYELDIFLIAVPASVLLVVSGLLFFPSGKDEQRHSDNDISK